MVMKKKHSPAFKFKVALEALKGRPIVDICRDYEVAASLVHKWKTQLQKSGSQVFGQAQTPAKEGGIVNVISCTNILASYRRN